MSADPLRAIADAVLYEGYILWPYRRSALKNQQRFTFGGVYPPLHSKAHPDDRSTMRSEVLLQAGADASVAFTVRFLQVVRRAVLGPGGEELDELTVGEERYLAWEEAVEREVSVGPLTVDSLYRGHRVSISIPAGQAREEVGDGAGALVRRCRGLQGELYLSAASAGPGVARVRVRIANTTPFAGGSRAQALQRTFCSTHTLMQAHRGAFVSLTDPPDELAEAAAACRNEGTWPVLVGEPGETSAVLCTPIILEDHPRVAPESPGDLFDGGEIDQLLTLNILALTDEEKAEMAASDPRAREILRRTEALTPDELMALHGTIRELRTVR